MIPLLKAAVAGKDCFDMAHRYLQGKEYRFHYSNLNAAKEGDVLIFTGKDGVCMVLYRGKDRGYTVANGRLAMVRIKDLLVDERFLAGVRLG